MKKTIKEYETKIKLLLTLTLILFSIVTFQFYEFSMLSNQHTGRYYIGMDFLTVKGTNNIEQMIGTCIHEVGHHIYHQSLTKQEKQQWQQLHQNSTRFVSDYATTNQHEDFAESFKTTIIYYYDNTILEYVDPNKSQFMQNLMIDRRFQKK